MGGLALCVVATTFTTQVVYKDYYSCTRDALTSSSRDACQQLLPTPLRDVLHTP